MNALSRLRVSLAPVLLAAALGVATLGVAACSTSAASTSTPSPAFSASSSFGGTDLAWIEITIAMDEQLQPLLDLVGARAGDPDVRALGLQVEAFTSAELNTLRALHDQAGLPAENPHEGMPMPGMVTPEQVTEAAALKGAAFDKVFVQRIKEHLTQGQSLARSEDKAGVEPQTKTLALQVLRTREQTLNSMGRLP